MVPRAEEQIVALAPLLGAVSHVPAIEGHGARLVVVVVARDGEDRNLDAGVGVTIRGHRVEILVPRAMPKPFLKMRRWVADERVELSERNVMEVSLAILVDPER